METAAAYEEPRLTTYGFQTVSGLSLIQIDLTPEALPRLSACLLDPNRPAATFELALLQPGPPERLRLSLVCRPPGDARVKALVADMLPSAPGVRMQGQLPVEMICFQGPHFGDRSGIALAGLRALRRGNVPVVVAGCAGSVINLVLPTGQAGSALSLLKRSFQIPRRERPGRTAGPNDAQPAGGKGLAHPRL